MTLKDRFKAECSDLGKIFKTWVARSLYLVAAIAALSEYLPMLPPVLSDIVPTWLKYVILGAGVISHIYGQMTVAKPKDNGQV